MNKETFRSQHSFVTDPAVADIESAGGPTPMSGPMTDPTLMRMQGRRPKRRSSLMTAGPAALAVALIGGFRVFWLTS